MASRAVPVVVRLCGHFGELVPYFSRTVARVSLQSKVDDETHVSCRSNRASGSLQVEEGG